MAKEAKKVKESTSIKPERVINKIKENMAESFDPYKIIKFPLSTEKSIRMMEFDNKLVFVVAAKATKAEVKKAIETMFKVKVLKVNIQNSITGQRKAYIKLSPQNLASDIGADLGMI